MKKLLIGFHLVCGELRTMQTEELILVTNLTNQLN